MDLPAPSPLVCGLPLKECLLRVEYFHGCTSPGVVLGLFMVDLGRQRIGPAVEADVIAETRHCLPDAVQLFTPCTVGNGWLKILDWDTYALTFYDRHNGRGHRIWLDLAKAQAFPNIYNWYMRRLSKRDLPLETLLTTIIEAGQTVLASAPVALTRFSARAPKERITVCPGCGEAFGGDNGQRCAQCRGEGYWVPSPANDRCRAAGR